MDVYQNDAERLLGKMHVHAYLSYHDACLILNMLACHALHLCVTLGKKARLHLIFPTAQR